VSVTSRLRALSARTFARLVTVGIVIVFLLVLAVTQGAFHLSSDASTAVAALGASLFAQGALRLRRQAPEDPVWLEFWAPIGAAIAVTGSACRLVAQSDRVPGVLSGLAVVGYYVLPIVVAYLVGRARLTTLPASHREAIENRFRRRVHGVRPGFVRRVGIGLAVVIGGYVVFALVALTVGWLRGR